MRIKSEHSAMTKSVSFDTNRCIKYTIVMSTREMMNVFKYQGSFGIKKKKMPQRAIDLGIMPVPLYIPDSINYSNRIYIVSK